MNSLKWNIKEEILNGRYLTRNGQNCALQIMIIIQLTLMQKLTGSG